jgi:hypothetical protein
VLIARLTDAEGRIRQPGTHPKRIVISNGHTVSKAKYRMVTGRAGLLIAATGGSGVGVDLLTTSVAPTTDKLQAQR